MAAKRGKARDWCRLHGLALRANPPFAGLELDSSLANRAQLRSEGPPFSLFSSPVEEVNCGARRKCLSSRNIEVTRARVSVGTKARELISGVASPPRGLGIWRDRIVAPPGSSLRPDTAKQLTVKSSAPVRLPRNLHWGRFLDLWTAFSRGDGTHSKEVSRFSVVAYCTFF